MKTLLQRRSRLHGGANEHDVDSYSRTIADLAGRALLAAIFLMSGVGKLGAYVATQSYMASQGVPAALLPLVIALELGGGLLVVAGLWTRAAAPALAAFTILAALLFHANFADPMQQIMFLKNLAIAGGFLLLAAHGAGAWSVDARRARRSKGDLPWQADPYNA